MLKQKIQRDWRSFARGSWKRLKLNYIYLFSETTYLAVPLDQVDPK